MLNKSGKLLLAVFILFTVSSARNPFKIQEKRMLPQSDKMTRSLCNISKWSYWVFYDGKTASNPNGDCGGLFPVPKARAIFSDGVIWGGKVDDNGQNPRVGGVYYRVGTVPGWIDITGKPVDPNDPRTAVYRIRPDWQDYQFNLEEFRNDAAQLYLMDPQTVTIDQLQDIYDQYQADWMNWPIDLGAPYYDVNENGQYDAGYQKDINGDGKISVGEREEPGYAGADQALWLL